MRLSVRRRFRIALLVIAGLLFQQGAMAAYSCPIERMPAELAGMAKHCTEMGMQQAQDNPTLCAKHCAPDHPLPNDHASPSVPMLALPPTLFDRVLAQSGTDAAVTAHVPLHRSDPPPRLRYCSLLI